MRMEHTVVFEFQLTADIVRSVTAELVEDFKAHRCKLFALCHKLFHTVAEFRTLARYHDISTSCDAYKCSVKDLIALEHKMSVFQHDLFFEYKALSAVSERDDTLAVVTGYGDNSDSYAFFRGKLYCGIYRLVFQKRERKCIIYDDTRDKRLQLALEIEFKEAEFLRGCISEVNMFVSDCSEFLHILCEGLFNSRSQTADSSKYGVKLLSGSHTRLAVGTLWVIDCCICQRTDSYHKELVEVALIYSRKRESFQQWVTFIRRLFKNTAVEFKP